MKRLVLLMLYIGFGSSIFAQHDTELPKQYKETLEPHLTPLDEVLRWEDPFSDEDEPGVMLLSETVRLVHLDGRSDRVTHSVIKALTEQGAKQIARRRFSFSGKRQRIHFISGRTISAEGKIVEVPKDGVFLQRASGDEDSALYDDQEELVLVMPEMKAGAIIETIVLREDITPLVEDQFSVQMGWDASWPIVMKRNLVGVGEEMNERFRVLSVGSSVPVPREWKQDDLVWREWKANRLEALPYEANRPPRSQVGPATWVTTHPSWESFGRWYGEVLSTRRTVGADLQSKADEVVEGSRSKREILDALFSLVAKEVRYTGLEFGDAALRPYDCGEVWSRKYGDCKDKSNLLVTLLNEKGIKAWLGLVNTEDAGLVHMKVPGSGQFNHAIVVVDLEDEGELVFCDPTVSYGRAGVIAPSVGARDVFVISGDGGYFVKSPDVPAGSYKYDFDLKMDESGRLSGWMNFTTEGYYAAGIASRYDGLDRDSALSRLGREARAFLDGAVVVDIVLPEKIVPGMESIELRAFITTPPREEDSNGNLAIPFPISPGLLMSYGNKKERTHTFYQWRDDIRMSLKISVPEGLVPNSMPANLDVDSEPYEIDASWGFEPGVVTAQMGVFCKQSLIEPEQVLVAAQAARATSQWLEQPLLLKHGDDWKASPPSKQVSLPLMPTGGGQLELVDRWYSLDGGRDLRKKALEKTIQLFPNDPETVFSAKSKLAYLLYYYDDMKEATAAYQELSRNRPRGVELSTYSFARYMWAYCLGEEGQLEAAKNEYQAVEDLVGVSDFRKGWAMAQGGKILLKEGLLDKAREKLTASEALEGDHYEFLAILYIQLALKEDDIETGVADWLRLSNRLGEGALDTLGELVNVGGEDWYAADADLLKFLMALSKGEGGIVDKRLTKLESDLSYRVEKSDVAARLRGDLLDLYKQGTPEYFGEEEYPELTDQEDFEELMKELENEDIDLWLQHARVYPQRFEADENFTYHLWRLLNISLLKERRLDPEADKSNFLQGLVSLCKSIPHKDGYYWECQFVIAAEYTIREEWLEADVIYEAMYDNPDFDPDFANSAWKRRGLILEKLNRWEEASECHLAMREDLMEYETVVEHHARGGLILARLGRYDEALEVWSELFAVPPKVYENAENLALINEAIVLAKMPEQTKAYWKSTDQWWKEACSEYAEKLGIELNDAPPILDAAQKKAYGANITEEGKEQVIDPLVPVFSSVAYSARWLPSDVEVFSSTFENVLPKYTPDDGTAFKRLALDLFQRVVAGGRSVRELAEWRSLAMRFDMEDDGVHADTLEMIGRIDQYDKNIREYTIYLLGETAARSGEDLEMAEELLKEVWAADPEFLRASLVASTLGKVLDTQGKEEELISLLTDALEHEEMEVDEAGQANLQSWLDRVLEGQNSNKAILVFLEKIQEKQDMSWLAYVDPLELGEERFEDQGDLWIAESDYHELERYKWLLQLLEQGELAPERQLEALSEMFDFHVDREITFEAANEYWDLLIGDESLPEGFRLEMYWKACVQAVFFERNVARLEHLAGLSIKQGLREDLKTDGLKNLQRLVSAFSKDAAACVDSAKELIKEGPLDEMDQSWLKGHYGRLEELDDIEARAEIRKAIDDAKFVPGSGGSARMMKLTWLRSDREAAKAREDGEKLHSLFESRIELLAEGAPEGWRKRQNYERCEDLTDGAIGKMSAAIIRENFNGARADMGIWRHVMGVLFYDGKKFQTEHLEEFLDLAPDLEPSTSEMLVSVLLGKLSEIEEGQWEALKIISDWLVGLKQGDLKDIVLLTLAGNDFPPGYDGELEAILERNEQTGDFTNSLNRYILCLIFLDRRDKESLNKLLDNIPEQELTSAFAGVLYLNALRWLDREEEAELVKEELQVILRKTWMQAWQYGHFGEYNLAVSIHSVLGAKISEDDAWITAVPALIADDTEKQEALCLSAFLLEDWKRLAELIDPMSKKGDTLRLESMALMADLYRGSDGARDAADEVLQKGVWNNPFFFQLKEVYQNTAQDAAE